MYLISRILQVRVPLGLIYCSTVNSNNIILKCLSHQSIHIGIDDLTEEQLYTQ